MIRALISDLDNTLFLGHGETVFDLTARNAEGLAELREAQVALYTASGRMSAFGEELLRRNGFTDIRSSGFDGASGTDHGRIAWQYGLEKEDALRALGIVNESGIPYITAQMQTFGNDRYFSDPSQQIASAYRAQADEIHIGRVMDVPVIQALTGSQPLQLGKFSIRFASAEPASEALSLLAEKMLGRCYLTRSDDTLVDVLNRKAGKGNMPRYLLEHCGYRREEIAVIGDALNDTDMFPFAGLRFAMANGEAAARDSADFIVRDVRECIDILLEENR